MRVPEVDDIDDELGWDAFEQVVAVVVLADVALGVAGLLREEVGVGRSGLRPVDLRLADKLSPEDKKELQDTIDETLDWMDENPLARKDEFERELMDLEGVVSLAKDKFKRKQNDLEPTIMSMD